MQQILIIIFLLALYRLYLIVNRIFVPFLELKVEVLTIL